MFVSAVLYFGLLSGSKAPLALAQTVDTPTPAPVATPQLEEWDGGGDENLAPIEGKLDPPKYANMDSNLNRIVQQVESGQFTAHAAASGAPIHSDESVAVTLYITEGYADAVVEYLEANGASPRNVGTDYIEAYVPVSLLPEASEQEGVLRIDTIVPPEPAQGAVVSEGVTVHGAKAWHDAGLKGRGVRIGIIDTGFEGFAALQGTELPASVEARCYTDMGVFTFNLADCTDSEDGESRRIHGTAVAEALFDVAPDATYYIANIGSWGDLIATAEWMVEHDVDVINMSVSFIWQGPGDGTSPFSDSTFEAVNTAVDGGITWVNAAGNGALDTWYGIFSDADADGWLNFSGQDECNSVLGSANEEFELEAGEEITVQLRWDDAWAGSSRDLDLYLFQVEGSSTSILPVASSEDVQIGGRRHVPREILAYTPPVTGSYCLAIRQFSGSAPSWVQLQAWGVLGLEFHTMHHSITSPAESANPGLLAVGAAPWDDTATIEFFSSQGPAPDGRIKPDIVGADRGRSVTHRSADNPDGRWRGTSQAAPHVAGLAALVIQSTSGQDMSPAEVANYLKRHAAPRGTVPNNVWGHGFARLLASDAVAPEPTATAEPTATPLPTATPIPDSCFELVGDDGTVSGSWADDCESSHPERSGRYARFYALDLAESSEVTIKLESTADPVLYVRDGIGREGAVLCENDDYTGEAIGADCGRIDTTLAGNTDSGLVASLSEGAYTIEATTYEAAVTGEFTLTVRSEAAALPEPTPTPTPTPVPTPGPSPTPGPTPSPTPVPLPPDFRIEGYACNEADLANLGTFVLSGTIGPVSIDSPGYTGVTARHNTRWVNEDNSEVISCTAIQFDSISNARWVGLDYAKQLQAFGADVDILSHEQAFVPWIGDDLLAYRTLYRANDIFFSSATVAFLQASTLTVSRVDYFNVRSEEYPDIAKPEGVALNVATRVFPEGQVSPQGWAAWGFDAYIETFDWLE